MDISINIYSKLECNNNDNNPDHSLLVLVILLLPPSRSEALTPHPSSSHYGPMLPQPPPSPGNQDLLWLEVDSI